jgi:hypothetical protein
MAEAKDAAAFCFWKKAIPWGGFRTKKAIAIIKVV